MYKEVVDSTHPGNPNANNSPSRFNARFRNYAIFLILLTVILAFVSLGMDFLLAPPYAVSAYIVVFESGTKYADRKSLVAVYLLVIATSDLTHLMFGLNMYGMLASLILVSAFITFTNLSHPPAIALTIFSYIANDPASFTVSSLLALATVLAAAYLIQSHPQRLCGKIS